MARDVMDALDVRIVHAIGVAPFGEGARGRAAFDPERIAAVVGQTPRLVKDRLVRLERDGFIEGYTIVPTPAELGLEVRSIAFAGPARKDLVRLMDVEGYLFHVSFLDDWLVVAIAYRDGEELARRTRLVATLLDAKPVTWFAAPPPAPAGWGPLEWRLLSALRAEPRAPVTGLAKRTGLGRKTVERRLAGMEGGMDGVVRLGPAAFEHLLFASILVTLEPGRERDAITALHQECLHDAWSQCNGPIVEAGVHHDLVVSAASPGALRTLLDEVAELPGVRGVQGRLATAFHWAPAWLDGEVARRTQATAI